jgi:hypothetical protein
MIQAHGSRKRRGLCGSIGLATVLAFGGAEAPAAPGGRATQDANGGAPQKTVGIVLFPEFEVLDVYGPLELWAYVPEFNVITVADKAGPVRSRQGVSTVGSGLLVRECAADRYPHGAGGHGNARGNQESLNARVP